MVVAVARGTKGPGARVGPEGWDQAGIQISLWACGLQKAFREEVVVWGLGSVVGWSWLRSGSGGSVDLMVLERVCQWSRVRVCGSDGSNEGLWVGQFLRVCTSDSLGSVGRIGTPSTTQVCKLIREVPDDVPSEEGYLAIRLEG